MSDTMHAVHRNLVPPIPSLSRPRCPHCSEFLDCYRPIGSRRVMVVECREDSADTTRPGCGYLYRMKDTEFEALMQVSEDLWQATERREIRTTVEAFVERMRRAGFHGYLRLAFTPTDDETTPIEVKRRWR